jgi:hypothetical protein
MTSRMKFQSSSLNGKVSGKSFVYNKVYYNKFIVIIFVIQLYILKGI